MNEAPKTAQALIQDRLDEMRALVMPELPLIQPKKPDAHVLNERMKKDGIPRRSRRAYFAAQRGMKKTGERRV